MTKERTVLIVAGGKGLRMGSDLPKQFIPIAGKPILMHTLERFHDWDANARILLVLPFDHQVYWQMLCNEIGCKVTHTVVNGGSTRYESVKNGLALVKNDGLVAVHDGVRPFPATDVIEQCFAVAERQGAAIPVLPMIDSLRMVDHEGTKTVDRALYFSVQTPQVFRSDILLDAYKQAYMPHFTDDASVVEANGTRVTIVNGNRENIKITTPFDLQIARALLETANIE